MSKPNETVEESVEESERSNRPDIGRIACRVLAMMCVRARLMIFSPWRYQWQPHYTIN